MLDDNNTDLASINEKMYFEDEIVFDGNIFMFVIHFKSTRNTNWWMFVHKSFE